MPNLGVPLFLPCLSILLLLRPRNLLLLSLSSVPFLIFLGAIFPSLLERKFEDLLLLLGCNFLSLFFFIMTSNSSCLPFVVLVPFSNTAGCKVNNTNLKGKLGLTFQRHIKSGTGILESEGKYLTW